MDSQVPCRTSKRSEMSTENSTAPSNLTSNTAFRSSRAEGWQFLLAFPSQESMVDWYERIVEAIAIALPLERRKEPKAAFDCLKKVEPVAAASFYDRCLLSWREEHRVDARARRWSKATVFDCCVKEETTREVVPKQQCLEEVDASPKSAARRPPRTTNVQRCMHHLQYHDRWRHKVFVRDGIEYNIQEGTRIHALAMEVVWG